MGPLGIGFSIGFVLGFWITLISIFYLGGDFNLRNTLLFILFPCAVLLIFVFASLYSSPESFTSIVQASLTFSVGMGAAIGIFAFLGFFLNSKMK